MEPKWDTGLPEDIDRIVENSLGPNHADWRGTGNSVSKEELRRLGHKFRDVFGGNTYTQEGSAAIALDPYGGNYPRFLAREAINWAHILLIDLPKLGVERLADYFKNYKGKLYK